jgi:hypothetical protein
MENSDFEQIKLEEIPKTFFSDGEKEPFKSCTFCSEELAATGEPYMIEKSYKINPNNSQKNTVFEYAICMSCNLKKMQAMSAESVANIKAYMEKNFVLDKWEEIKTNENKLDACVVTGTHVDELEEYNVVGQFICDQMIVGHFPILLSPSIGDEIQELLSQETKDEFDDFMNTITDVPPELKALFKTKRPVLV